MQAPQKRKITFLKEPAFPVVSIYRHGNQSPFRGAGVLVGVNQLSAEAKEHTALLLRAQIERELAEGNARVSLFYLPAALGGQLEFVRDIVTDAVTQNQNAGVNIANASTFSEKDLSCFLRVIPSGLKLGN